MTALLETSSPVVGTSWREWECGCAATWCRCSSTTPPRSRATTSTRRPRIWANISLRAEQARELALELQNAAGRISEDVLEEWGLG